MMAVAPDGASASKAKWHTLYQGLASASQQQWVEQAQTLLDHGDGERAKLILEAHLHKHPEDTTALLLLSRTCLLLGPSGVDEAIAVARWVTGACSYVYISS